uniref:Dynactin subunit 6 n=1 Tax=Sinocyclocheilus rhinocerous TaxID=307959 RepID=A0A673JNN5_9TELE
HSDVKIAAGAVVCVESDIRGDVTIGARTVVHPKARIIAEAGPIVIGEGNLIEEQALIINRSALYYSRCSSRDGLQLPNTNEHNNLFPVSQALKIGDNNVIESKGERLKRCLLLSFCIIDTIFYYLTENTVIYGSECLRRVQTERPQPQTLQLDFLMKILPNYHHLKKTVKASSTPARS